MGKKYATPATVDELLASIRDNPSRIAAFFAAALRGPGKESIERALREDASVRAAYRAALRDLDGLDETPWLVRFAGKLSIADASPELLAIAKADLGSKSEQAALALLELGSRASLTELSEGIETQRFVVSRSVEALFVLGDDVAFDRLAPLITASSAAGNLGLFYIAKHPDVVRREPRWLEVMVNALSFPKAAEAARAAVMASLTPEERTARLGHLPRAVVSAVVFEAAREEARAAVDRALAKLSKLTAPDPRVHERLTALRTLLGRVPPVVQALHERVDGIEVSGPTPADGVTLYSTESILEAAREWDRTHRPRESPALLVPAFCWPVAPDGFTRAGLSGGPAYGFELTADIDDPVLTNAPKKPTYLAFVTRELRRAAKLLETRA